jgi:hypothetical protein
MATGGIYMMSGIGQIATGLFDMNQPNPANAANQYYNQIPGMLNSTYQPWMQQGQSAYNPLMGYMNNGSNMMGALQGYMQNGEHAPMDFLNNAEMAGNTLNGQLSQMATNPGAYMNHIGQSFQQSPGYQWGVKQATMAANRAAAAGGMVGSPMEQQTLAQNIMGMANQNYGNWMNRAMGQEQMGLSGLQNMYQMGGNMANNMYGIGANVGQNIYGTGAHVGQNIYDTGANMANQYGTNMADSMMNQGNLAYAGQMNQNQQQGGAWGDIIGGIGSILGL